MLRGVAYVKLYYYALIDNLPQCLLAWFIVQSAYEKDAGMKNDVFIEQFFFYLPTCFSIQKRREELERLEKEKQTELRSYKGLMVAENMTSNKQIASGSKSLQELEEDFM